MPWHPAGPRPRQGALRSETAAAAFPLLLHPATDGFARKVGSCPQNISIMATSQIARELQISRWNSTLPPSSFRSFRTTYPLRNFSCLCPPFSDCLLPDVIQERTSFRRGAEKTLKNRQADNRGRAAPLRGAGTFQPLHHLLPRAHAPCERRHMPGSRSGDFSSKRLVAKSRLEVLVVDRLAHSGPDCADPFLEECRRFTSPGLLLDLRVENASVQCRSVSRLSELLVGDLDDAFRPSGSTQSSGV